MVDSVFKLVFKQKFFLILWQQQSEEQIQVLLGENRYEDAIIQLLECQSAAVSLRRFTCVAVLSAKLQDTLVMTEEQLDVALGKVESACVD